MAVGWSKDGEVQDQIDSTVEEGLARIRSRVPSGESHEFCEACQREIPRARRKAIPGVRLCIACQSERERE